MDNVERVRDASGMVKEVAGVVTGNGAPRSSMGVKAAESSVGMESRSRGEEETRDGTLEMVEEGAGAAAGDEALEAGDSKAAMDEMSSADAGVRILVARGNEKGQATHQRRQYARHSQRMCCPYQKQKETRRRREPDDLRETRRLR